MTAASNPPSAARSPLQFAVGAIVVGAIVGAIGWTQNHHQFFASYLVAWLFWKDATGLGTFLLVWTIIVATMDNFLRPILIRKGADLPLLLIFGGVIGGLLAFGLVGLFIGPVVLAITYKLLQAWIDEVPDPRLPLPAAPVPPEHPTEPHE